jgi:phosphatidylinositol-bisphosphatase
METNGLSAGVRPPPPGAFPENSVPEAISTAQTLAQAVYARRSEYVRPKTIKIKIGSWNVAALAGTEKDIGAWFVQGKGITKHLAGLSIKDGGDQPREEEGERHEQSLESVADQEHRSNKKESTVPKGDTSMLPHDDEVALYVLGLQEIVDVSSLGEALRPFHDSVPAQRWKTAVSEALPKGYVFVKDQQLMGLYMLIYAAPWISDSISDISAIPVGTGIGGYVGNKGAVSIRIVLGETTRMLFVNCHLAAGNEKGNLDRRNWDAHQVLSRTKFDRIVGEGGVLQDTEETIGDEDFAFWFGDLNYRLANIPGDDIRRLLMLHTQNEYDDRTKSSDKIERELGMPLPKDSMLRRENSPPGHESVHTNEQGPTEPISTPLPDIDELDPENDPASLQTTISSLLPHDQLHDVMRKRQAFHEGWKEGPIKFLPTYKYDVGSVGMFDSSEKKRGPSWCDRILYRTRRDLLEYRKVIDDEETSKRRDEEMSKRGLDKGTEEEVLYDYDPEADGADEQGYEEYVDKDIPEDTVITKAGYEDRIELEHYTSHQRVLSSDHKPLDAIFTLTYQSVDPELKEKVRQECARELDKAENEGRPQVTLVVDYSQSNSDGADDSVNFGDFRFDQRVTRGITVANTGQVTAKFSFVARHDGNIFPPWLSVEFDIPSDPPSKDRSAASHPPSYTIHPGDAANALLHLHVNSPADLSYFNNGAPPDEILILRVAGGRDHFLPIRGTFLPSAFGRSIDQLIRIPEGGVRSHVPRHQSDHEQEVKSSAPRELFRLTAALEASVERAVAEWDMKAPTSAPSSSQPTTPPPWATLGWPFEPSSWTFPPGPAREATLLAIRECLDTGREITFPTASASPRPLDCVATAEALAETLLLFLSRLPTGLISLGTFTLLQPHLSQPLPSSHSPPPPPPLKPGLPTRQEALRATILDTLAPHPAVSVSFTFITFTLAHLASLLSPLSRASSPDGILYSLSTHSAAPASPLSPASPRSPDALLGGEHHRAHSRHARTASTDNRLAREGRRERRRAVQQRFVELFAERVVDGRVFEGLLRRSREWGRVVGLCRVLVGAFVGGEEE